MLFTTFPSCPQIIFPTSPSSAFCGSGRIQCSMLNVYERVPLGSTFEEGEEGSTNGQELGSCAIDPGRGLSSPKYRSWNLVRDDLALSEMARPFYLCKVSHHMCQPKKGMLWADCSVQLKHCLKELKADGSAPTPSMNRCPSSQM